MTNEQREMIYLYGNRDWIAVVEAQEKAAAKRYMGEYEAGAGRGHSQAATTLEWTVKRFQGAYTPTVTFYKKDGELCPNLPANAASLKSYLLRGFTLTPKPRPYTTGIEIARRLHNEGKQPSEIVQHLRGLGMKVAELTLREILEQERRLAVRARQKELEAGAALPLRPTYDDKDELPQDKIKSFTLAGLSTRAVAKILECEGYGKVSHMKIARALKKIPTT